MKHGRSVVAAGLLTLVVAGSAAAWGEVGHRMIGTAAAMGLPDAMPTFFTDAVEQLSYLNPEPDRWRNGDLAPMDEAFKYDHYIDLENVPDGALDAEDRWTFLEALYESGLENPHQAAGFLPFRILELQQRLTTGLALWRLADAGPEKAFIEERIINDAGVLGHYVADASNPHHSTIHYNGWAEDAPNPEDYTTSRDFHWRFESLFVQAHITYDEVARAVPEGTTALDDVRQAIWDYIQETNDLVVALYELEKEPGFDPETAAKAATEAFAVDRLATGATMLRSLWYTAWVDSEALAAAMEADGD